MYSQVRKGRGCRCGFLSRRFGKSLLGLLVRAKIPMGRLAEWMRLVAWPDDNRASERGRRRRCQKGAASIPTRPLGAFIGRCTTFRTRRLRLLRLAASHDGVRLCVPSPILSDGAVPATLQSKTKEAWEMQPPSLPRGAATDPQPGPLRPLDRTACLLSQHFRQSRWVSRAKSVLQESTAFQNTPDRADGSPGQTAARPPRQHQKRHAALEELGTTPRARRHG
jgi:hypothetical protein